MPRLPPFVPAVAAAAVVVTLSGHHARHQADTLIPVLASLQKWEPFFWQSDRNGQLVPLLAAPVRDPFANLLLQCGLTTFAGLLAVVLAARVVTRGPGWGAAAGAAGAAVLLGFPANDRFHFFAPSQVHAVSLALAAGGLLLLTRPGPLGWGRAGAGLGLFALAGWVNVSLGVGLGPWLAARWVLGLGPPGVGRPGGWSPAAVGFARGGAGLAAAAATGAALTAGAAAHHDTDYGWLPPGGWAGGVAALAGELADKFALLGGIVAAAVAAHLVWRAVRGPARRPPGPAGNCSPRRPGWGGRASRSGRPGGCS